MIRSKKLLIVSILASAAHGAYADETVANLKGGFSFTYGHLFQSNISKEDGLTANKKRDAISTEGNIRLELARQSDFDFNYGLKLVLTTTTDPSGGASANGSHLYISRDDLGKLEIGSPFSAARKMHVSYGEVDQGSGGGWTDYVVLKPKHTIGMDFRDSDKLYTDSLKGKKNEPARKISYYTPEFNGLQLGISYTPDTYNVGDVGFGNREGHPRKVGITGEGDKAKMDLSDLVSGGISYKHNISDGIDVKIALTGEYANKTAQVVDNAGNVQKEKLGKLRAYNIGAHLSYGNFGFAGSYGNLGKSLSARAYDKDKRNSHFYTLGAEYVQGPLGFSLTHYSSNHRGNKLKSISAASSYKFAKGLTGFVELTRFDAKGSYQDKATKAIKSYKPKGYTLLTGLSVTI